MTWILLRGLTREAGHWGAFAGSLSQALGGDRVITLDLPGNGALHAHRSPLTLERVIERCRVDVETRGLRPPLSIVAMSLGGMVAVGWAERYPNEVQRCVLINTSLRPYSPFYRRLRPANYLPLACAVLAGDPAARERRVLRLTSGNIDANAGIVDAWIALSRAHPVSRANALRQLVAAARFRAPDARLRCDVLVLASRCDRLVDVRCSREIARRWQAPLCEHASAGHDLPLDDPDWVIERVRTWVAHGVPAERESTGWR